MGSILALVGILVVIGIASVWMMRRRTEDREMDSTQWIESDFSGPHSNSHAEHSSRGDAASESTSDSGGESPGDSGGLGSDSGGSGGD